MKSDHPVQIAPSMMCADLWRLPEILAELESIPVDLLHFDLMDAHYVPNMPMGLGVIEALRSHTGIPFDAHLMVQNNDFFVDKLAHLGVQQVSVHAEATTHLDRTLALIRGAGMRAGVALNPATPLCWLDFVIEHLDFVLVMTVNPGFAGQKLVPAAMRKIAGCRDYLAERGVAIPIQVDGNVSFQHIPAMVAAGARSLVCGTSSLFHPDGSLAENAARTRASIGEGLALRPLVLQRPQREVT
jgi:ribulose-phosphate 3-epimerase